MSDGSETGDGDGDGDGDGETGDGDGDGETGDGDASIVAAGWSFGECAGACVGNLSIGEDDLVHLAIEDWSAVVLGENSGTLTAEGRAQLDGTAAQLLGVSLDETYGCPDCDDGGASYIELRREGMVSSHAYENSAPPPILEPADTLTVTIIDALLNCVEGPLLDLDEGCEAL